jgi:hypothetical protein
MKYTAQQIKSWDCTRPNGKPVRPENAASFWQRCKNALMVVIGCYDVIDWEGN